MLSHQPVQLLLGKTLVAGSSAEPRKYIVENAAKWRQNYLIWFQMFPAYFNYKCFLSGERHSRSAYWWKWNLVLSCLLQIEIWIAYSVVVLILDIVLFRFPMHGAKIHVMLRWPYPHLCYLASKKQISGGIRIRAVELQKCNSSSSGHLHDWKWSPSGYRKLKKALFLSKWVSILGPSCCDTRMWHLTILPQYSCPNSDFLGYSLQLNYMAEDIITEHPSTHQCHM